ncbi:MAG: hypothetical protein LBV19_02500 [Streptococcaceae bacterium]|jgi:hypothetical protein|nr:hypothetical protein [Streptococcaceae bacterium]
MAETEITLKNTKAEILEALHKALQKAKDTESRRINPIQEEKVLKEQRAVASTKVAVEQANVFSKELNEKFSDLQLAIATEETRLEELYKVGSELQRITLALEAGKTEIAALENEKAEKSVQTKEAIASLSTEFAQKKAALEAEQTEYVSQLKRERARETEEYDYNLKRQRDKDENEWSDKARQREADLSAKEAKAQSLLEETQGKTEYIASLETEVATFSDKIESEKASAVAACTAELKREAAHETALAELTSKAALTRLEDKISFMAAEQKNADDMIQNLQAKLDKAYSEMKDLAAQTVESSGNVKIIGSSEKINA